MLAAAARTSRPFPRRPARSPRVATLWRRAAAAPLLLLIALASPAAAAEQTIPLALGSTGLALDLTLWRQTTSAGSWSEVSAASVTTTELGAGRYVFGNLPTATGTQRYKLEVALASAPTAVLAEAIWGAIPGTTILWRPEIEIPASPQTFKVGDTFGAISMRVARRLPAALCDPETTATFTLFSTATGAAVTGIDGAHATITSCALDQTTGTYGATFQYDLAEGTPSTPGNYLGEWRICYAPSACHTLPADNRVQVRFTSRFGS